MVLIETNALQGSSLQRLYQLIRLSDEVEEEGLLLRQSPLGTCTICVGKKEVGWKNHFGILQRLDGPLAECLYRGE